MVSISVSKSGVSNIIKRRSAVLLAAEKNLSTSCKRLRFGSSDEEHWRLDHFVYKCFLCAREKDFLISGHILQAMLLVCKS